MSNVDQLPDELLDYILRLLNEEDISNFCYSQSNTLAKCHDSNFWLDKLDSIIPGSYTIFANKIADLTFSANDLRKVYRLFSMSGKVGEITEFGAISRMYRSEFTPIIFSNSTDSNISTKVIYISAAYQYYGIVTKEWDVYTFGYNNDGILGHTNKSGNLIKLPKRIHPSHFNYEHVSFISFGGEHAVFVTLEGNCYATGSNIHNAFGPIISLSYIPQRIAKHYDLVGNVIQSACGLHSTLLLTKSGNVYGCGHNTYGMLGLGPNVNMVDDFVRIPNLNDIIQISCGVRHSLFLKKDGTVYRCGYNIGSSGEIANKNIRVRSKYYPEYIPMNDRIIQISSGEYHSVLLTQHGELYVFGHNHGNLGLGDEVNRVNPEKIPGAVDVVKVSCGHAFNTYIDIHGNLYVFGKSLFGLSNAIDIFSDKVRLVPIGPVQRVSCGADDILITKLNG